MKNLNKISTTSQELLGKSINWAVYRKGKMELMISEPIPVHMGRRKSGRRPINPFIRQLKDAPAVYVIENLEGEVVYVGASASDAYKTLIRHFQVWNDKGFDRKYYRSEKHKIRIVLSEVMSDQYSLWAIEAALIELWKPKNNRAGIYSPHNHKSPDAPLDFEQEARDADLERTKSMAAFILEEPEFITTSIEDF